MLDSFRYDGEDIKPGLDSISKYCSDLKNNFDKEKINLTESLLNISEETLSRENRKQILNGLDSITFDLISLKDSLDGRRKESYLLNENFVDMERLRTIQKNLASLVAKIKEYLLKDEIYKSDIELNLDSSEYESILKEDIERVKNLSIKELRKEFLRAGYDSLVEVGIINNVEDGVRIDFTGEYNDKALTKRIEKAIGLYELYEDRLDEYIKDETKQLLVLNGDETIKVKKRVGRKFLDEKGKYVPIYDGTLLKVEEV